MENIIKTEFSQISDEYDNIINKHDTIKTHINDLIIQYEGNKQVIHDLENELTLISDNLTNIIKKIITT